MKGRKRRLKSDYDDVDVYRKGACLFAVGNPKNVRKALMLTLGRVIKRGVHEQLTVPPIGLQSAYAELTLVRLYGKER